MSSRQDNQTQTADSDKRWRDKVTKYDRFHITIHRLSGCSIKAVASCQVKLARNQRLTVKTNDNTPGKENLHLEMKGLEYESKEGKE